MRICGNCGNHEIVNDNFLCQAYPIGRFENPITKKVSPGIVIEDDLFIFSRDFKFTPCRYINRGNCSKFNPKETE